MMTQANVFECWKVSDFVRTHADNSKHFHCLILKTERFQGKFGMFCTFFGDLKSGPSLLADGVKYVSVIGSS